MLLSQFVVYKLLIIFNVVEQQPFVFVYLPFCSCRMLIVSFADELRASAAVKRRTASGYNIRMALLAYARAHSSTYNTYTHTYL